jgi:hypothetical protein
MDGINRDLKQIEIYDIQGVKKVLLEKAEIQNGIDLSDFSAGVYILQVTFEDGIWTDKFIRK